jgi:hypothetical protein
VAISFAVTVRTSLQRQNPLSKIEDQKADYGQGKDTTAGPATRAGGLNRFRQQIEKRCSE